jgi:hypothetical protein
MSDILSWMRVATSSMFKILKEYKSIGQVQSLQEMKLKKENNDE